MPTMRNDQDVTAQILTTDPGAVRNAVTAIHSRLYGSRFIDIVHRAFVDVTRMYRGEHKEYRACDTAYHNMQHVLDVTLAMARLMDGHERSHPTPQRLGARNFCFGLVLALFHDFGYLRTRDDTATQNGAEYTLTHVARGARFLERYLFGLGLGDLAPLGSRLIHFTGYEVAAHDIDVADPIMRRLGQMLGTADIVAQMADRCYLEKCRDRLYPEFISAGIAVKQHDDGSKEVVFESAADLVAKTPNFYRVAMKRLTQELESAYRYAEAHFDGENLYLSAIEKNIRYAEIVGETKNLSLLRRVPPPPFEVASAA